MELYAATKRKAVKALYPGYTDGSLMRMTMQKKWSSFSNKKTTKRVISLMNPQLDLFDGLYTVKSPT